MARESTAGQYDRYGPASQREQQDRFIERHGLVDTGLVFQVAHSGTTVWRSATMTEMLDGARAGSFDLLLAGYSDRWQRNLRRTLELLEDGLHPAGVALVMCDRRILSSDPHDWDELISEAAGAEKYSRRLLLVVLLVLDVAVPDYDISPGILLRLLGAILALLGPEAGSLWRGVK